MDTAVNTRPLLQQSETDSDFESDLQVDRSVDNFEDEVAVSSKDTKPLFKSREPSDRYVKTSHLFIGIYTRLGLTANSISWSV